MISVETVHEIFCSLFAFGTRGFHGKYQSQQFVHIFCL